MAFIVIFLLNIVAFCFAYCLAKLEKKKFRKLASDFFCNTLEEFVMAALGVYYNNVPPHFFSLSLAWCVGIPCKNLEKIPQSNIKRSKRCGNLSTLLDQRSPPIKNKQ